MSFYWECKRRYFVSTTITKSSLSFDNPEDAMKDALDVILSQSWENYPTELYVYGKVGKVCLIYKYDGKFSLNGLLVNRISSFRILPDYGWKLSVTSTRGMLEWTRVWCKVQYKRLWHRRIGCLRW